MVSGCTYGCLGVSRGLLSTSEMHSVKFQTRNTNVQSSPRHCWKKCECRKWECRTTWAHSPVPLQFWGEGSPGVSGPQFCCLWHRGNASPPACLVRLASRLLRRAPGEHVLPDTQPLESDSVGRPLLHALRQGPGWSVSSSVRGDEETTWTIAPATN